MAVNLTIQTLIDEYGEEAIKKVISERFMNEAVDPNSKLYKEISDAIKDVSLEDFVKKDTEKDIAPLEGWQDLAKESQGDWVLNNGIKTFGNTVGAIGNGIGAYNSILGAALMAAAGRREKLDGGGAIDTSIPLQLAGANKAAKGAVWKIGGDAVGGTAKMWADSNNARNEEARRLAYQKNVTPPGEFYRGLGSLSALSGGRGGTK